MEHKQASEKAKRVEGPVIKDNSSAEHFDKAIALLLEFDCSEVRKDDHVSIDGVASRDQHIDLTIYDQDQGCNIRANSVTVTPDAKNGPQATISWPSMGAVSISVACTFAMALLRAAELAKNSLAEKLAQSPAKKKVSKKRAVSKKKMVQ